MKNIYLITILSLDKNKNKTKKHTFHQLEKNFPSGLISRTHLT